MPLRGVIEDEIERLIKHPSRNTRQPCGDAGGPRLTEDLRHFRCIGRRPAGLLVQGRRVEDDMLKVLGFACIALMLVVSSDVQATQTTTETGKQLCKDRAPAGTAGCAWCTKWGNGVAACVWVACDEKACNVETIIVPAEAKFTPTDKE